jgi:hypothetical protein
VLEDARTGTGVCNESRGLILITGRPPLPGRTTLTLVLDSRLCAFELEAVLAASAGGADADGVFSSDASSSVLGDRLRFLGGCDVVFVGGSTVAEREETYPISREDAVLSSLSSCDSGVGGVGRARRGPGTTLLFLKKIGGWRSFSVVDRADCVGKCECGGEGDDVSSSTFTLSMAGSPPRRSGLIVPSPTLSSIEGTKKYGSVFSNSLCTPTNALPSRRKFSSPRSAGMCSACMFSPS